MPFAFHHPRIRIGFVRRSSRGHQHPGGWGVAGQGRAGGGKHMKLRPKLAHERFWRKVVAESFELKPPKELFGRQGRSRVTLQKGDGARRHPGSGKGAGGRTHETSTEQRIQADREQATTLTTSRRRRGAPMVKGDEARRDGVPRDPDLRDDLSGGGAAPPILASPASSFPQRPRPQPILTMTDCLFCRIVREELPSDRVLETDDVIAFRDLHPQAPVHVLVIPRRHVNSLEALSPSDRDLPGALLLAAAEVARREGVAETGYRVVTNTGAEGGQTVGHLHLHVLGGRGLGWPPG